MGGSITTYVTSVSSLFDQGTTGAFLNGILLNIEVFNIWAYVGMATMLIGVILNVWYKNSADLKAIKKAA